MNQKFLTTILSCLALSSTSSAFAQISSQPLSYNSQLTTLRIQRARLKSNPCIYDRENADVESCRGIYTRWNAINNRIRYLEMQQRYSMGRRPSVYLSNKEGLRLTSNHCTSPSCWNTPNSTNSSDTPSIRHSGKWPSIEGTTSNSSWSMPVDRVIITSRFNPRRMHPVKHKIMPHNGCDFGAGKGIPVYAINSGLVTIRGWIGDNGNLVKIQHGNGYESGYAHLSGFAPGITVGSHVERRTVIGYVGSTGSSTNPHLHLSLKHNGAFIDPLSVLKQTRSVSRSGLSTSTVEVHQDGEPSDDHND